MQEQDGKERLDQQADAICRWGAARAGVIVVAPFVGTVGLMANEVYMVLRLAKLYGVKMTEASAVGFIGAFGGTFAGQTLATLLPFPPMQMPIAVAVTYGIGKAAQLWIKEGMSEDVGRYKQTFEEAMRKAKSRMQEFRGHPQQHEPLGDEQQSFRTP